MQMPHLSGLEWQAQLNREPNPPAMNFVSACVGQRKRKEALKHGAVYSLGKPFCTAGMIACVERLLADRAD